MATKPAQIWLITDTHFNHDKMVELCGRPANHTQLILENWRNAVSEQDTTFHLGDVILGRQSEMEAMIRSVPGKKILILGNHDQEKPSWYMKRGFDFACEAFVHKGILFTHYPAQVLPVGATAEKITLNIHGHLHNSTHHGDIPLHPWNKKLAIEETNYKPVLLEDFIRS